VAFRGTKDVWPDLLTDATFLPRTFTPPAATGVRGGGASRTSETAGDGDMAASSFLRAVQLLKSPLLLKSPGAGGYPIPPTATWGANPDAMLVHGGFLTAFESIRQPLDAALLRAPKECDLLLVGHSMGGALATLAAAHLWERNPQLITFGGPATGNAAFAAHVEKYTRYNGGLRVWNRADVIVTIALAAGYRHCGLSLPGVARAGAIAAFERARAGLPPVPALALAAPHVLHQLGSSLFSFPVIWSDVRRKPAERAGPAQPPPAAGNEEDEGDEPGMNQNLPPSDAEVTAVPVPAAAAGVRSE